MVIAGRRRYIPYSHMNPLDYLFVGIVLRVPSLEILWRTGSGVEVHVVVEDMPEDLLGVLKATLANRSSVLTWTESCVQNQVNTC